MRRLTLPAPLLVFTFILVLPLAACAQDSPDRRLKIAENLKFRFEQLQGASVSVTKLEGFGVDGMDIGTLLINGQQQLRFLVTKDDTRLFLLAADPVDVSMDAEGRAKEVAERSLREAADAKERHTQLMALSKSAPSLGPDDAPVTVVEFSDFQCPYCARVVPTVKELLAKYPEQVRLVFMDFPLNIHPWAEPAAIMAGCAARQSETAFWSLHDYYFANQSGIDPQNILERSRGVLAGAGIDMPQWESCATDKGSEAHIEVSARMRSSMQAVQSFGASGTPYFFVNGFAINGAAPLSDFVELVEKALDGD